MKERIQLPTKAEINNSNDLKWLEELEGEIEHRVSRMEVDLLTLTEDEEWHKRARAAMAFHKMTLGYVSKRIYFLSKGGLVGFERQLAEKNAKAAKKEAAARRAEEYNKTLAIRAQEADRKTKEKAMALIERTSYLRAFNRAAYVLLGKEQVQAVEAMADKLHNENIIKELQD